MDKGTAVSAQNYSPLEYHQHVLDKTTQRLAFNPKNDVKTWQAKLRQKLREILGLPENRDSQIDAVVAPDSNGADFICHRVSWQSEPYADVPGYLLTPKKGNPPFPVMIYLQGHRKEGMMLSMQQAAEGGRNFAIQAVENGWAALAIEQHCFGERPGDCTREALHALMLGKTLTGERVFDVFRAIDFIRTRPELDAGRIGCMGNSTGGTVTFYAVCLDQRIRLAVVSCSFCSYAQSWMKHPHCACGYLPGILNYADMGDLGGLVAPRHFIIVAGKEDSIADISGVQAAFNRSREVFKAMGCEQNALLLIGDGGHQFYPELAWPEITKMSNIL